MMNNMYSIVAKVNDESTYLIGFTKNPRDFFVEWMNKRTIEDVEPIGDNELKCTIIAGGLGVHNYHLTASPLQETTGIFIRLEGDNCYYF